jgi:hypothetical protein
MINVRNICINIPEGMTRLVESKYAWGNNIKMVTRKYGMQMCTAFISLRAELSAGIL